MRQIEAALGLFPGMFRQQQFVLDFGKHRYQTLLGVGQLLDLGAHPLDFRFALQCALLGMAGSQNTDKAFR